MKKILLLLIVVPITCQGMWQEEAAKAEYKKKEASLSEYQKSRDKMLIDNFVVYSFSHLNELTEEKKDERFNERFDMRSYVAYESKRCLKWAAASVFASFYTAACAYVLPNLYTDALPLEDQCLPEPDRTNRIVACSICGVGMCCAAVISTAILCCDVCKGLRYGKSQQKKYEQVLQLKMGAKKNE